MGGTGHDVWTSVSATCCLSLTVSILDEAYEGCSGSSWNLVIKCSNIDIPLSCFNISQVDIFELASRS